MNAECSIFFHNYYGDHEKWLLFFLRNLPQPFNLYYNIVAQSIYNAETDADALTRFFFSQDKATGSSLQLRYASNKGKDIGGKLVLLDACMKLGAETPYGLFIHDKKSPYKPDGPLWAGQLMQVADQGFATEALRVFKSFPNVGIVAASGTTKNEFDAEAGTFTGTNNQLLLAQMTRYQVKPADHQFVAGTMFWFRMKPVILFFQEMRPMEIRATLENGNVLDESGGSVTHSWERLLSWIISAGGYKIKVV